MPRQTWEKGGTSIILKVGYIPSFTIPILGFDHAAALLNRIMNVHVSQLGKRLPTVYGPFGTTADPPRNK
jgi:hypothetical protein